MYSSGIRQRAEHVVFKTTLRILVSPVILSYSPSFSTNTDAFFQKATQALGINNVLPQQQSVQRYRLAPDWPLLSLPVTMAAAVRSVLITVSLSEEKEKRSPADIWTEMADIAFAADIHFTSFNPRLHLFLREFSKTNNHTEDRCAVIKLHNKLY